MTAYLCVTAHFVTAEWELRSVLLAFAELQGRHTAENTADVLYTIIKDFGIEGKVRCSIATTEACQLNVQTAAKSHVRQCLNK